MKKQLIETKNTMVNLDKESRDAIETYAKQNNLSRSEAIRHAIAQLTGDKK